MTSTTYNGSTNYETWNASLWIGNDEALYTLARGCNNYSDVVELFMDLGITETGDGVRYDDPSIDTIEMTEMVAEL